VQVDITSQKEKGERKEKLHAAFIIIKEETFAFSRIFGKIAKEKNSKAVIRESLFPRKMPEEHIIPSKKNSNLFPFTFLLNHTVAI